MTLPNSHSTLIILRIIFPLLEGKGRTFVLNQHSKVLSFFHWYSLIQCSDGTLHGDIGIISTWMNPRDHKFSWEGMVLCKELREAMVASKPVNYIVAWHSIHLNWNSSVCLVGSNQRPNLRECEPLDQLPSQQYPAHHIGRERSVAKETCRSAALLRTPTPRLSVETVRSVMRQ